MCVFIVVVFLGGGGVFLVGFTFSIFPVTAILNTIDPSTGEETHFKEWPIPSVFQELVTLSDVPR